MILRSIQLENIRSYKSETISFPEGRVLLSGDIGSGKSTILLAIEFGLFGVMRAEVSGESLLRHGQPKGSVILNFEVEGKQYSVKRTLKRSKNSVSQENGYLATDDIKFEGTPVELKAKIISILGYPEELVSKGKSLVYRFTVFTAQEEMKQILLEDKDIRLDTLRKVFGIDRYKTIRENVVFLVREIKRKKNENEARIEGYDETLKQKNERLSQILAIALSVESMEASVAKIKLSLETENQIIMLLEQEVSKAYELRKEIEVKENVLKDKEDRIIILKSRIDEKSKNKSLIDKRLAEYSSVNDKLPEKEHETRFILLQENLNNLIKLKSEVTSAVRNADTRIMKLEEELGRGELLAKERIILTSQIKDNEAELTKKNELESILSELIQRDKVLHAKSESTSLQLDASKSSLMNIIGKDECPVCKQKITEIHKHILSSDENDRIKKLEEQKNSYALEAEEVKKEILSNKARIIELLALEKKDIAAKNLLMRVETELSQQQRIAQELSELKLQRQENEKKLERIQDEGLLRSDIQKIKEDLESARKHNARYVEKIHLEELLKQDIAAIYSLKLEHDVLEKEISAEIDWTKEAKALYSKKADLLIQFETKKASYLIMQEKMKAEEIGLASENQKILSMKEEIERNENKLGEMNLIKIRIEELAGLQEWMDSFFANLMVTMEKHVMVSIHKEFSLFLKEWFSVLVDEIDITLDDEFTVRIIQDGYETEVESLSGGEKTSVALAYRLALNKVINDLIPSIKTRDLIILDEPTDGFSSEQLDKLRDILAELNMKQTIIVSHEAKMESYVEKVIRISKTDGISVATD